MSAETNKQLLRDCIEELFCQGNIDAIPKYFRDGTLLAGTMANRIRGMHSAFTDREWEIEDMLADDNKVMTRVTLRGTNTGSFFGHPPTGKYVYVTFMSVSTISEGKVISQYGEFDRLMVFEQLGITPIVQSVS